MTTATLHILEGITRASVIEQARNEMKLQVVERSIRRQELYVSDETCFTGTAVEVSPILPIDHRPVGTCEIGPVTAKLLSLYEDATHGCIPADRRWLWAVFQSLVAGKVA